MFVVAPVSVRGGAFSHKLQKCDRRRISTFLRRLTDSCRHVCHRRHRVRRRVSAIGAGLHGCRGVRSAVSSALIVTRRATRGIGEGTRGRTRLTIQRTRGRTRRVVSSTRTTHHGLGASLLGARNSIGVCVRGVLTGFGSTVTLVRSTGGAPRPRVMGTPRKRSRRVRLPVRTLSSHSTSLFRKRMGTSATRTRASRTRSRARRTMSRVWWKVGEGQFLRSYFFFSKGVGQL